MSFKPMKFSPSTLGAFKKTAPKVFDAFNKLVEEVRNYKGLDRKTQLLVSMGIKASQGTKPSLMALNYLVPEAKKLGATKGEIVGVYLVALVSKNLDVSKAMNIALNIHDGKLKSGKQPELFGISYNKFFKKEAPKVSKKFDKLVDEVRNYKGLDRKAKLLISIGIKASQGTISSISSLEYFVPTAMKMGVTREQMKGSILVASISKSLDCTEAMGEALKIYEKFKLPKEEKKSLLKK